VPEAQSCLVRFGGNACFGGAVTYVGAARYDDSAMTHNWRMVSLLAFRLAGAGSSWRLPRASGERRIRELLGRFF